MATDRNEDAELVKFIPPTPPVPPVEEQQDGVKFRAAYRKMIRQVQNENSALIKDRDALIQCVEELSEYFQRLTKELETLGIGRESQDSQKHV